MWMEEAGERYNFFTLSAADVKSSRPEDQRRGEDLVTAGRRFYYYKAARQT